MSDRHSLTSGRRGEAQASRTCAPATRLKRRDKRDGFGGARRPPLGLWGVRFGTDPPRRLAGAPELEAAIADGTLTIAELAGLPSLRIGYASFYQESVRNSTQGQRHPSSTTVARGTTTDGAAFRLHVSEKLQGGERSYLSVQIEFDGK